MCKWLIGWVTAPQTEALSTGGEGDMIEFADARNGPIDTKHHEQNIHTPLLPENHEMSLNADDENFLKERNSLSFSTSDFFR